MICYTRDLYDSHDMYHMSLAWLLTCQGGVQKLRLAREAGEESQAANSCSVV